MGGVGAKGDPSPQNSFRRLHHLREACPTEETNIWADTRASMQIAPARDFPLPRRRVPYSRSLEAYYDAIVTATTASAAQRHHPQRFFIDESHIPNRMVCPHSVRLDAELPG